MRNVRSVIWSVRSVEHVIAIRSYLRAQFTQSEVHRLDMLLEGFERNVTEFARMYPRSTRKPMLRRAVLSRELVLYYQYSNNCVVVVAVMDSRYDK